MNATFDVPEAFWRYAAAASGATSWPPRDGEREAWLASCRRHRLLPLAGLAPSFPPAHRAAALALQARDAPAQAARHDAQRATFARLREDLPDGSWLGIKGIGYARRLYPQAADRPMDDVDLLLRPGVLDAQRRGLPARGFAPRAGSSAWECSFVDTRNGVVVDLYRAFTQPQRVAIDYDELWQHAEALDDGTPVPAAPHALAVHALLMANMQFTTHLRKYLDLWLMARDETIAVQAAAVAARWRMRRAFAASLAMLARIEPSLARNAGFVAARAQLGRAEAKRLDAILPASPLSTLPVRPLALWRKWHLMDAWSQRLRFGVAHFTARGGPPSG